MNEEEGGKLIQMVTNTECGCFFASGQGKLDGMFLLKPCHLHMMTSPGLPLLLLRLNDIIDAIMSSYQTGLKATRDAAARAMKDGSAL